MSLFIFFGAVPCVSQPQLVAPLLTPPVPVPPTARALNVAAAGGEPPVTQVLAVTMFQPLGRWNVGAPVAAICSCHEGLRIWEFPKIGDPNIVP